MSIANIVHPSTYSLKQHSPPSGFSSANTEERLLDVGVVKLEGNLLIPHERTRLADAISTSFPLKNVLYVIAIWDE